MGSGARGDFFKVIAGTGVYLGVPDWSGAFYRFDQAENC